MADRPVVLSTRATRAQEAIVRAAALEVGKVKADFIHEAVMRSARETLGMATPSALAEVGS